MAAPLDSRAASQKPSKPRPPAGPVPAFVQRDAHLRKLQQQAKLASAGTLPPVMVPNHSRSVSAVVTSAPVIVEYFRDERGAGGDGGVANGASAASQPGVLRVDQADVHQTAGLRDSSRQWSVYERHRRALTSSRVDLAAKGAKLVQYDVSLRHRVERLQTMSAELARKHEWLQRAANSEMEKLIRTMQFEQMECLQRHVHIQDLYLDNVLQGYQISMVVLKERLAMTESLLDEVADGRDIPIPASFFATDVVLFAEDERLRKLKARKAELEQLYRQSKARFLQLSRSAQKVTAADRRRLFNQVRLD